MRVSPRVQLRAHAGEGTRFTRSVEMRLGGVKVLMTPVMAFMVRDQPVPDPTPDPIR
jgi:hypothetical protein